MAYESQNHDRARELQEEPISAMEAKQGGAGRRILTILVAALILAFIIWIPVEIWGKKEANEVSGQQPGAQIQEQSVPPQETPATRNGSTAPGPGGPPPAAEQTQPAPAAPAAPARP